ncbi:endo alpha-1,4 polygalactosaminidase [Streptomyces indicus]|uniref:Glycoside-hydrolase family GH114 TIM-barrel domain-containing protein n=1 Tax=Streptomyces indicus TaxID=417292 RepID=A0A1G8X9G0_9ACTN|nr:endo alpha-1,4 polygalactosaminidase [Streptomyces indicus]SDJ87123.1 hypothetical protein SAMN05421806_10377 [Streptomyces indicus]
MTASYRPLLVLFALLLLAACSAPSPGPAPAPEASSPGSRTPAPEPSSPASRTPAPPPGPRWRPAPGTAWQWQLDGPADTRVDVPVYDIDGFENDAATVRRLHRAGRKVICYINAGAWEDFRPDRAAFPPSVRGRANGWPGERWLDIRRIDVLRPLMAKRFDMCRAKGFDAVEPDLMDAYLNDTGFPLTARHQLAYNRMLAKLAHDRGMSVGLKNDLPQVAQLVREFDFAVNEECAQYKECEALKPFIAAGKAVLHVEYALPRERFCAHTRALGFSSMRKRLDLGVWRQPC